MLRLALASVLTLAVCASVQAQSARELTREALREFERGNYEEARALFLRAHDEAPSARLLRGAGMAAFEVRDYVQTHRLLSRALASDERPLTEAQRAETRDLLERTQAFIGRFRLELEPPDAQVTIDLRPPERTPDGTILLSIGEHTLTVEAPEHRSRERRLDVRGGEDESLRIALEAESVDVEPTREPERAMDTLGWALVGGGGGLVALSIVGAVGWANASSELGTCRDWEAAGGHCLNEPTLSARSRSLGFFTIVAGAAGLAALAMGMLRWWWSEETDGEASARCTPGVLSVDCRWRF